MKRAFYFIMAILLVASAACHKHSLAPQTPPPQDSSHNDTTHTDTVSNSRFTTGALYFTKDVSVVRGSMADSLRGYFMTYQAEFWGSPGSNYVGGVYLNDNKLGTIFAQPPMMYEGEATPDSNEVHSYDSVRWKIISTNNFVDMTLTVASLPAYDQAIPHYVSHSGSLTIPFTNIYPDADSIEIIVRATSSGIDTVLQHFSGPITFSSSKISQLLYNPSYPYGNVAIWVFKHSTTIINGRTYYLVNGTVTGYDLIFTP